MIDRLEELLSRVEESEEGGERPMQLLAEVRLPAAKQSAGAEGDFSAADAGNVPGAEKPLSSGTDGDGGTRSPLFRTAARPGYSAGMDGLYRQLSRSVSGGNAVRSGSVAVVRETVSAPAAGLTAGELDLAMRRDSRRYDGGMTIY